MNIFLIIMATWIVILILKPLFRLLKQLLGGYNTPAIFEHNYIESKPFYMYKFGAIPNTTFIDDIDISKAFDYVQDTYANKVDAIYQSCSYNQEKEVQEFGKTLFVLDNDVVIELSGEYARVLYQKNGFDFTDKLVKALSGFKLPEKKEDFEINIITFSNNCLDLKSIDIKPTTLDVDLYYNDDFKEVDNAIKNRLNQQNDKGIVLLHGLPGTGKTTYLRHLIGTLKKKVLFVSPSVAGNLMNPDFIDLLIDNPNSILVIEDTENIMMDRKHNSESSVSNLLNLSDGLLSDCLSVQIICTFNSSLNLIDSALMRKGRLIARYEFGKLSAEKSQVLSNHFGFNTVINQPMTIAEIANQNDRAYEVKRIEVIGFRKQEALMN